MKFVIEFGGLCLPGCYYVHGIMIQYILNLIQIIVD
jgi:hypothetical protein